MTRERDIKEDCHDPLESYLRNLTRRRFFGKVANTMGAGLGSMALGTLLKADGAHALPSDSW